MKLIIHIYSICQETIGAVVGSRTRNFYSESIMYSSVIRPLHVETVGGIEPLIHCFCRATPGLPILGATVYVKRKKIHFRCTVG
jgi:hypothetical protein